MIYLSLFVTVTLGIYGLFLIKSGKKDQVKERMSFYLSNDEIIKEEITEEKQKYFFIRLIISVFLDFKKSFKKKMPEEKEEKIEKKLQMAGNPFGLTPIDFRLVQTGFIFLLPLLFGGYATLIEVSTNAKMCFILLGFLTGLFIPNQYLKQKTKARGRLALREFPDILDLLTVSLEAGLGFDAAITKVVSKKEGILANEFHRSLEEIRLGKTRREALSGIRDRLEVDSIKAFISSVLQAEKLGIGMVQVLRVQSNEVREQRRQRAEEAAMKAPIKMLFPLVLFIFPSLFIVLLGPAIIQIIATFKK